MGAQRPLTRRRLLELSALYALTAVPGCRRRDRASVLSALVTEVVLGMARALRTESRILHAEVRALAHEPSLETLGAARAAFAPAILAWKRAYAFRSGPFVASDAFQQAAFWPARPTLIDGLLTASEPIDEQRVEQLNVDARGLYALEYLLFDEAFARSVPLPRDPHGERVRAYALELAVNIAGYASRVQRLLGDGQTYAASFAAGGAASVNTLVSQLLDTLAVLSGKFARVNRARAEARPLPFAVEGYFSKTSLEIVLAILEGTKQLYLGGPSGGLGVLVASTSQAIDEHVRRAFAETEQQLHALGMPLEAALEAAPARFQSAAAAVTELRHVIEVELVSALSG